MSFEPRDHKVKSWHILLFVLLLLVVESMRKHESRAVQAASPCTETR